MSASAAGRMSDLAPYSLRQAPTTVSAGTPVYNAFIWIITLLPLLSIVTLLTGSTSVLQVTAGANDMYRDPSYLALFAIGPVVYGGAVLLAYLDRKKLLRDGFDRPFHWAWTFFGGGVYVIGRSIIVSRRAGRGRAPIWVWISITLLVTVLAVVSTILTLVRTGVMMATMMGGHPFSP